MSKVKRMKGMMRTMDRMMLKKKIIHFHFAQLNPSFWFAQPLMKLVVVVEKNSSSHQILVNYEWSLK